MSDSTILVVDDDLHMLELLVLHVEGAGYAAIRAENGLEAIQILEKENIKLDAIISDVEMPKLDGYELCSQVRELDKFKELPFVFVSAKTSLEEKLKGYGVGGDEYISKPVDGEEVVLKVKHIIDNKIIHHDMAQQIIESRNAAMQAMNYTSNLGQVLQFMQVTSEVTEFDALADKLFAVTESMGLVVVVQFHTPAGIINYKKNGSVSPLEANVIELARNKGRIFDFESRTIFNDKDFSLLVLNMPVEDSEKYGMMKDVLGSLCDAVESRVKFVSSNTVLREKDATIHTVNSSLQHIDRAYHDVQEASMMAIDEMIQRMEEAMFGFGLSESQEDTVRGIVMYTRNKAAEVFEDGKELYKEFEKIHNVLLNGSK
ncbi:MAG: response regulator [Gammaproteobacteria bacterium]|nr:response regulator [Gammaproteobacteria bacterium]